jgi:hypothetical protein
MTGRSELRTAGDLFQIRQPERDYPAAAFLWFAPDVPPTATEKLPTHHHFMDHGVVTWRSGWGEDATAVLFRVGPPAGHGAARKLKEMTDWTINAGHVHPDIGAFYLYAKNTYLAGGTGYTAEKWTKDHNTLLIDGKGQAVDGSYHNDRGVLYEQLDEARLDGVYLSDDYAYASGTFGEVYARQVPGVDLVRKMLATKDYLVLIDDLSAAEAHKLTFLVHSDAPFKPESGAMVATHAAAKLAVFTSPAVATDVEAAPTIVQAGTAPTKPTPTQRGHHLAVTTREAAKAVRLVHVLAAVHTGQSPPIVTFGDSTADAVTLTIDWPDRRRETLRVDLRWSDHKRQERWSHPVTIERSSTRPASPQ